MADENTSVINVNVDVTGMVGVLVTTAHRGVFFGYIPQDQDREAKAMTLKRCRNVIYWSGSSGFLGLANHGPEKESRVGAVAPETLLQDLTSVSVCTDEAAKVWNEYPTNAG